MSTELQKEGFDINVLSVNAVTADTEANQQNLIDKCSFPLFQDTEEMDVWGLHDGGKDDFYIFDAEGALVIQLPYGGPVDTNLTTEAGYASLKGLILKALAAN